MLDPMPNFFVLHRLLLQKDLSGSWSHGKPYSFFSCCCCMVTISVAGSGGVQYFMLISSSRCRQLSGCSFLQATAAANITVLRVPSGIPCPNIQFRQGDHSTNSSTCSPNVKPTKTFGSTDRAETSSRNLSNDAASPSSSIAKRSVCSESKYGRLIKLPTSPRSTRICSCFGNISQPPYPR